MKKVLLLLYVFSIFLGYSQKLHVDINENTQNIALVSSDNFPANFIDLYGEKKNIIRENYQIPAFNLYNKFWDTLHIRSQSLPIPFYENLIKIILVQENNSAFSFPCAGNFALGYGNKDRQFHSGIDYFLEKNDPIVSCFDGVVRMARKYGPYGNCVVIRHYNGLETIYGHLENVCVKSGQIVKSGDLIGNAGISGNTNYHILHLEMRFMNEFFNPEKVIDNTTRRLKVNILELTPEDFYILPIPSIENSENQQIQINTEANSTIQTPIFHIIKQGETLYKIAKIYNTSTQEIIRINNLKNNGESIQAGQKLKIR